MGASTPPKNQSAMMRDGDENGFADEEDDDDDRGRGRSHHRHQATLTAHFVKLLEKTEERVERLERKSEEQRRREEEMTESFGEKFRNLVKHVNGKLGDIRSRVFVGGGEKEEKEEEEAPTQRRRRNESTRTTKKTAVVTILAFQV